MEVLQVISLANRQENKAVYSGTLICSMTVMWLWLQCHNRTLQIFVVILNLAFFFMAEYVLPISTVCKQVIPRPVCKCIRDDWNSVTKSIVESGNVFDELQHRVLHLSVPDIFMVFTRIFSILQVPKFKTIELANRSVVYNNHLYLDLQCFLFSL